MGDWGLVLFSLPPPPPHNFVTSSLPSAASTKWRQWTLFYHFLNKCIEWKDACMNKWIDWWMDGPMSEWVVDWWTNWQYNLLLELVVNFCWAMGAQRGRVLEISKSMESDTVHAWFYCAVPRCPLLSLQKSSQPAGESSSTLGTRMSK